ncbi:MAG: tRNA wybutosine-synthesizing 3 family protein [Candidatus Diapherotrites archaeon]
MQKDFFSQRKFAVLSKLDKSFIGEWDKKIIPICEKINSKEEFYTTSSCAGRIVLMLDKEKKSPDLFLKVWHDRISFNELKKSLKEISGKNLVKFKFEPPILHIACRDLESASRLLEKAKSIGWRRSGINALGKNIVLELNSTERLEFPILDNGKVLVEDNFLKLIIKQANEKLKKGWRKIEKLREII